MLGIDDALGGGILSGLGSWLGGNQQSKLTKEGIAENKREFNLGSMGNAAKQQENAPLRDKLFAIFGQMLGQPYQQFIPRDAFNPRQGAPGTSPMAPQQMQQGGMNPASMATPQGYKMGDGGVNPDVYAQILAGLGYKPPTDPSRQPQTPQAPQGQFPGSRPYFGNGMPMMPQRSR